MTRLLRSERGGILALSALIIPGFLLLTALVLDVGTWYTHKRSLQNRADAGALAAGVEYLSQLANCAANPTGPAATTISDKAKLYAGAAVGGYNETVNQQSNVTVKINAASPTDTDNSDGGNPCQTHPVTVPPDPISPNGGIWTDVIVRESNIGTLAGTFGINLPSITAKARVELKQVLGVRERGLPFVAETGDQIECVWAQFVRARDGSTTSGFSVTPSNPIPLTGGPYTWTGDVTNLQFTNAHDDIAIRYWAGSRDGAAPCNFATVNKKPLPHQVGLDTAPASIDWINVYDTGAAPAPGAAPKLRHFGLTKNTCGGPGFLYTTSLLPAEECQVTFTATVDNGPNNESGEITVNPHGTGVDPVTASYNGSGEVTVGGTIHIFPNEVTGNPNISQDYTQVGATYFSVSWHQTTGHVGTGGQSNCPGGNNCSGTFQGETVSGVGSNIQHQIYTADSLASTPLVATSKTTTWTSYPALGQTGAFTVSFTHTAIDKEHVVLIRDSGQQGPGTGNRTRSIYCGNGPGGGAAALGNAIRDGCAKDLVVNQRGDSCSPAPAGAANPWDCVQLEQGQKASVAKGLEDRFACTPNNWAAVGPLPWDGDQRWAYIILTGYGRTPGANNGDWIPIEGLVRVYVTGWDKQGGGGGPAPCAYNDDPPRNYDTQGAQLWGHLVSPWSLDPAVIIGDPACNLSLQNPQCKPVLVR